MKVDENAIHFGAIRQAFANNNASVMVGAGFSRNAEGGDSLATWPMVGKALWTELNPDSEEAAFSTGMVTQLGEQYSRVFSVPALENLLKQLIPDDKVAPGLLHDQLLKLPWSEIFTTNYDTLLERAAEKILDRAHFTVCCREDIPLSKILDRRRIVKLHGSFPSQRPFIFTEEHYRKYPQDFAPFVNLVRQSLLENVFCLIGFSGDDPNFLHWIGWVRDMLDEHALPIYLFVHSPPTLGQRRLLEARRVIPVVVPLPQDCAVDDYRTRYLELFRILRMPLDTSDEDWGSFSIGGSSTSISEDPAAQLAKLVASLPVLVAQRASYPGWFVAPAKNRRNLDRSLNSTFLQLESPQRYGLQEHPHALVTLFAYYTWQQGVLLEPIIDDFAEAAVAAIEATAAANLDTATARTEVLSAMGITDQKYFRAAWIEACVGMLRWARQELKQEVFSRIKTLLESKTKAKLITDEIEYEAILFDFYLGDVEAARRKLAAWRPGTVDAYMLVRKGSLMSELGDLDEGLALCMDGIKHLRAAQKIGRKNLLPLSQEAWACQVAHNIQQAKKYSRWFAPQEESVSNEDESIEHLSVRLSSLAAKGFDVRREREEILSQLNAEAQRPSVPRYRFQGFDLGATSTTQRFGHPSELQNKIKAAEAWLNLADRVSLVPRIGNVRFTVDAYTQAAWWIQYNNTNRRMFSVAIRTGEDDIFKPKDETVPQHKTGWLSRYQVARTDVDMAIDICERALTQAEFGLVSNLAHTEIERICKFNVEVFSRLVIRIDRGSVVHAFANRLIGLHCTDGLQNKPHLWESFAVALKRSIEAMTPSFRPKLLAELMKIPVLPLNNFPDHLVGNWARPFRYFDQISIDMNPVLQKSLDSEIAMLLTEVVTTLPTTNNTQRRALIWDRLFALKELGLIPKTAAYELGQALWSRNQQWPILPHFPHTATFVWPAPEGINPKQRFQTFVLEKRVSGISSSSTMLVQGRNTRRSWGFPARNEFFTDWLASHEQEPWSDINLSTGLNIVKEWWDSEWADIEHDVGTISELREAVVDRLHLIDEIFDLNAHFIFSTPVALSDDLAQWIAQVIAKAQAIGCPMWRSRLHLANQHQDTQAMDDLQRDLSAELVSPNSEGKWRLFKLIKAWTKNSKIDDAKLTFVLDTVFAVIVTKRMPAIGICICLAEELIKERIPLMTASKMQVLGIGMNALLRELDYVNRALGTDISDEHIPLLRYYCARLAATTAATLGSNTPDWVSSWIEAAKVDPLPELRFMQ